MILLAAMLSVAFLPLASAQTLTDPNPANDVWVESTLVIQQPDLTTYEIVGSIVIRKYTVEGTAYETADDLGDAYQQLVQADEYARGQGQESRRADAFVVDIESNTRDSLLRTLQGSFAGAIVEVEEAVLDRSTLAAPEGNPYEPGVLLEISARVQRTAADVGLGDLDPEAIQVVFDAGARVSADIPFSADAGNDVTYVLLPPADPSGLQFLSAGPAPVATLDAGNLVVRIDNAAGTELATATARATLGKLGAASYTPEQVADGARVTTTVDLQDIDITLGGAAGGDMGNLVGRITIAAEFTLLELPPEFQAALPDGVELDHLSANTIRLLYAHGAIKDADLDGLESAFREQAQTQLRRALQVPVEVEGGLVRSTLDATGVTTVEGGTPLRLEATAAFVKPLSGAPAPSGAAAIALYTQVQSFDLPRVQGFPTSYTVILPPGLALTDLSAQNAEFSQGTSADGRDQFTVSPEGESSKATVAMAVTPSFVMAKFAPLVIGAVILLILLVGTPIALVVRHKKKSK